MKKATILMAELDGGKPFDQFKPSEQELLKATFKTIAEKDLTGTNGNADSSMVKKGADVLVGMAALTLDSIKSTYSKAAARGELHHVLTAKEELEKLDDELAVERNKLANKRISQEQFDKAEAAILADIEKWTTKLSA